MTDRNVLPLSRRATLGAVFAFSFAGAASARGSATTSFASCAPAGGATLDTIYAFDTAGKPIEWDYPSGTATRGGLNLAGLGLQRTGSPKNTSDPGFSNVSSLASRFLDKSGGLDWHPASLWSAQFGAKAISAVARDRNKVGATSISDAYFAFQRVGGVNPGMLQRVGDDSNFRAQMQAGRTYYAVDYHSLEALEDNDHVSDSEDHGPGQRQRYVYQPKALFVADGGHLKPVAIEIRRGRRSAIVEPGDADWEVAKFIIQNADANYHQLVSHLGKTHLYLEAFAVAAGMTLPASSHPISRLLRPHFEGTININDFATTDLINICPESEHGGVIDLNFSGTMASNVRLITEQAFGLYDAATLRRDPVLARRSANFFNQNMFPRGIAERGVGQFREERIRESDGRSSRQIDIPVLHAAPGAAGSSGLDFAYPFLEDGCRLWNAITDWVCRYVDASYASDEALRNDCELQNWAQTVSSDGHIRGFGEYRNGETLPGVIQSRAWLVQALTSLIFTASVEHTAVNFTQADFGDSLPAGIYRDYFADHSARLADYLPNEAHFKAVMNILSVLASSQYTTLGKYHENTSASKRLRSVSNHFDDRRVRASLDLFQETLDGIEADIERRGADSNGHSYAYLMPSKIPQSVNV